MNRENYKTLKDQQDNLSLLVWILIVLVVALFFVFSFALSSLNKKPDWNHVSFSMTVFQTFLATFAIGGFWMVRKAVKDKAEEVTKIEMKEFISSPEGRQLVNEELKNLQNIQGQPVIGNSNSILAFLSEESAAADVTEQE